MSRDFHDECLTQFSESASCHSIPLYLEKDIKIEKFKVQREIDR